MTNLSETKEVIKTKILENVGEGDLLLIEIDVDTTRMPIQTYNKIHEQMMKSIKSLDLKCKCIIVPNYIKISRILKTDPGEVARKLDVGFAADELVNL